MHFKEGVDRRGVHPRIWSILHWMDYQHHLFTGEEVIVTCLRRPFDIERSSRHSPLPPPPQSDGRFLLAEQWDQFMVTACDIRRWALDGMKKAEEFCKYLQREHGDEIGVVLEPEWLSAQEIRIRGGLDNIAGHIHWQLKLPVKWELWR